MPSLKKILKGIKADGFDTVRTNFIELLAETKDDSDGMAWQTAEKIERWLILLAKGDLDEEEFNHLIKARERVVREYMNTLEIKARTRLEKTVIALIEMAIEKIIPHLV
jgi:hypothetical protein